MTDDSTPPVRERETVHESLLEMATDPLYVVEDGILETVNGSFVDLTGYERSEIVGMAAEELVHEDDLAEWGHRFELFAESDSTDQKRLVGRIISKNGSEIPVECRLSLLDTGPAPRRVVGRVRDLREKRQQEKKLDVLNRALRHNIRNEMNVVVGKAAQLQRIDDEGYRTAAEKIEEVGRRVINLSEKARLAQEHIGIPADEDCRLELVEVIEDVIMKFGIEYPEATIETELPADISARAPPSFEVALQELLENAVIHHPSGNGPVTVEIASDRQHVEIRIIDECGPIPDQIQRTITRGSEDPLQHNDGLGLWIVKWTVETVGGTLCFRRREDDEGNVITITFETIADQT
jgi:PAS domain S-box-containing protein